MPHKHEQRMMELDQQIVKLIEERWALFLEDTNKEEITHAYEMLCDDPYNTLYECMSPEDACGKWFLVDEALEIRRWREEDDNATQPTTTSQDKPNA